ncbi:MAG TPA: bile acid:sodium symporter, partial [Trebonia sp.]|nr:bile acid:sodium symporter [Trebonia sp.]
MRFPPASGRRLLAAYPELAAVLAAAAAGLCVQRPLAWLAARQGIDVLLGILVFATAVTIDGGALRRLAAAWRPVLAAVLAGVSVLPALSWAVSFLVPAGPLRDGVLVTGLAPCEIASVATTALAGGEAAVAAGVLIGSTLGTVVLAAPILRLEAGHASFSPAGVIVTLAVVVALPLAVGVALRSWPGPAARALAASGARKGAARTALAAVAALV